MMGTQPLEDAQARRSALIEHDRTLLVEAGAGSGKTAVLAGRIALMLAQGVESKAIAAVTFTELAASELLFRVREFVSRMLVGDVPAELILALPTGLSQAQLASLQRAEVGIDDLTCSTIHGFCQKLIRPYPVEANVDPGASIMDPDQARLAFMDIVHDWLRENLDEDNDGLLAELMLAHPSHALTLVNTVLSHQRQHEDLQAPSMGDLASLVAAFSSSAEAYSSFLATASAKEPETVECAAAFVIMAEAVKRLNIASPAGLVGLVQAQAAELLCKADGGFKVYRRKGKWGEAAKLNGRSKAEGDALNLEAQALHEEACRTWNELLSAAASQILHELLPVLRPAVQRMQDYKRSAALLDFDDLLIAARDLLRFHPEVRASLAAKFRHVMVDEFQDTDPVQTEIFWRLCGDPSAADDSDWRAFRIRPGALFLVGDPKQAIYRFRGADVSAYLWARDAFSTQDLQSVVSIAVNFRSRAPILEYVNERFAGPLAQPGQPGFTSLEAIHPARENGPSVVALDVSVADENGKATATEVRDGEAEAVARLCAHLVSGERILDPVTRQQRLCRPGDIALLAPTGADLWRYEQALEDWGVPVATQAGKGFFRRQEIQDLIALTRVLADGRDTLALGALMRGPLVGVTDDDLLSIVFALRNETQQGPSGLTLRMDAQAIDHPVAKDLLLKLQSLRRMSDGTTPHALLSQAIEELQVRPLLIQRCGRQSERPLANVDLYLNMSRSYDVRGLSAFAEAMAAAWDDEARAVEGRPDAQEEAVALYSMHAAKGLEWPVVIPINGMTAIKAPNSDVVDRETTTLYCPVLGVAPAGHDAAMDDEKQELERERVRLWYVAATRARELLVIPRVDIATGSSAWRALVDLGGANLPSYEVPEGVLALVAAPGDGHNEQTPEVFQKQAASVVAARCEVVWSAPSRNEEVKEPAAHDEGLDVFVASTDGGAAYSVIQPAAVQGGRERGLIIHKLLEEILTGEAVEDAELLITRARELAAMLGVAVSDDSSIAISPVEVASAALRALSVAPIAAIRHTLVPEYPVYGSVTTGNKELVSAGIVDAISLNADGTAAAVVDWKSDVEPTAQAISHYKQQVRAYLDITGTPKGYVVFATAGTTIEITAASPGD